MVATTVVARQKPMPEEDWHSPEEDRHSPVTSSFSSRIRDFLRVIAEEGASGDEYAEIERGSLVRGGEVEDRDGGRANSDNSAYSYDDPSSGEVTRGGRPSIFRRRVFV
ncbi:hypothetical protein Ddye_011742 [Dipteronia dyeriana]|uniref:Uncharacterized protein n=1 Tax=Dipteronia dyeriana TaxID=168575 RepID=A0AAD9X322_9ROSI|nr:hypothetical protein Ddye_011742 [Dipteronia dyeriana]